MLLTSRADELELENWRSQFGRCQLPPERMRDKPSLNGVLEHLPITMGLMIRTRLKAGGWLGPLCLNAEEVHDIETAARISRREIMVMLLDVAAAMAQTEAPGAHIGAVVEGGSGALYLGTPLYWQGKGIKFIIHGVQAAILNAWHNDEPKITNIMVETQPCTCCRQFIRETVSWSNSRLLLASDGPQSLSTGNLKEIELNTKGLKLSGIKARLLAEMRRGNPLGKTESSEMFTLAGQASSLAYAPYSRNFAGVALKTKRGTIHQGRYAETGNSMAGVLAIESALMNMVLCGEAPNDVTEILLVETRGTVTQFSETQQLALAMGNVPFQFKLSG